MCLTTTNSTASCCACGKTPRENAGALRHVGTHYICSSGACSAKLIEIVRAER
jgi:hypothetical protein